MADFHRVVGIDLGTTFSCVAAYNLAKQDVQIIPNKQNENTTPSVVYIGSDGRVSVGKAARRNLLRDPKGVIIEVKRLMGEIGNGGKKKIVAGGREYEPEVISAFILKELKAAAERRIGEPIHDVVITVPAYFKEPQKNATREAARIARLNPRLIINEPTAAAVAYGLDSGEEQTFIVYDFGGGTFDVSVVRIADERTVEILGTGGDAHLGGGDIDQAIVDWILAQLKAELGKDLSGDAMLVGRLRLEAETVKVNLCNEGQAQEIVVDRPTESVPDATFTLDVATFERMVAPLVERTLKEVDVALASAKERYRLSPDDIDAIILVGGSSKIPQVTRALADRYRKPVRSDLNPDEIVAMGAARMGMNFEPSLAAELRDDAELKIDTAAVPREQLTDTDIKDVVSHTLGIGLKDDVYDALIPKDHVIPHEVARKGYSTAEDDQRSVWIPVYQGDNPKASANHKIGEVVIDGLEPRPKGWHRFEVTFALDVNGIFDGKVHHVQTNRTEAIKLDRGSEAITEKRRMELAGQVDSGMAPVTPPASGGGAGAKPADDPIEALANRAKEILPTLPLDRQRELQGLLTQLTDARRGGDQRRQGMLSAQITMLLLR
jgi:molecular chaperone DnaK (HSP70)